MGRRRRWLLVIGLLVVAGVGTALAVTVLRPDNPDGGDAPTTPRSLAYVVAEHVDLEPTKAGVDWAADRYRQLFPHPKRAVGASANFAGEGNIIVVAASPEPPRDDQFGDFVSSADLEDGVTLIWVEETPEEDPGVVYLSADLDSHHVVLSYYGPKITGDPRDLDLPVSVDTLADIATDARVAPTTSQEAIDGGAELDFWLDGNPVI